MSSPTWDRFQRSVFIKARPQRVFEAWIIPEQIETWFLKKADFFNEKGEVLAKGSPVQKGASYAWQWWNYDGIEKGEYQMVDTEKLILEFRFAQTNTVKVWIEERDGDTLLRLEQSNIPTDDESKWNLRIGCSQGWSFWMVNLKAWLEHGVLLHDQQSHHLTKDFEFCELINR